MGKPPFSVGRSRRRRPVTNSSRLDRRRRSCEIDTGVPGRGRRLGVREISASRAVNPAQLCHCHREFTCGNPEGLDELLIDELRDILHAEKAVDQGASRMAEAARFDQLRELFEHISRRLNANRAPERML